MSELEVFMKNVAYLRQSHGLTKKQMAKILGVGVDSIDKLERGTLPKRASVRLLFIIQDKFNIPISRLFDKLY